MAAEQRSSDPADVDTSLEFESARCSPRSLGISETVPEAEVPPSRESHQEASQPFFAEKPCSDADRVQSRLFKNAPSKSLPILSFVFCGRSPLGMPFKSSAV